MPRPPHQQFYSCMCVVLVLVLWCPVYSFYLVYGLECLNIFMLTYRKDLKDTTISPICSLGWLPTRAAKHFKHFVYI